MEKEPAAVRRGRPVCERRSAEAEQGSVGECLHCSPGRAPAQPRVPCMAFPRVLPNLSTYALSEDGDVSFFLASLYCFVAVDVL